jgi:N-acetyl-anhydromuramyl-L-alanine amidase AmpD
MYNKNMEIPFKQTQNYQIGTQTKRGYVFHQTIGGYQGSVDWLCNSNRPNRSSAHYVIGRNEGEVIQLVKTIDDAWHAGIISNPAPYAKERMLKNPDGSYVNPNRYTIGIEFTSRYDVNGDGQVEPSEIDITEWQYKCAMEILQRNSPVIPVKPDMLILSHKEISDYKGDDTIFIREEILKRLFPVPHPEFPTTKEKIQQAIDILKSVL